MHVSEPLDPANRLDHEGLANRPASVAFRLTVAPNGARRTRQDHPALPVTVPQIVDCAARCFAAGADEIHLHVRDKTGAHSLDAGMYREAMSGTACAFGPDEQSTLLTAQALGGHVRIGFENNVRRLDGSLARDNADQVVRFLAAARSQTARTAH